MTRTEIYGKVSGQLHVTPISGRRRVSLSPLVKDDVYTSDLRDPPQEDADHTSVPPIKF